MLERPCEGVSSKTVLRLSDAKYSVKKNVDKSYHFRRMLSNIYSWLLNIFCYGKTAFLEETEEKMMRGVDSSFYRFLVDVDVDVSIFTLSSVPYDVLKQWVNDELDACSISRYKLDKPAILFIHGFAGGSCFWINNLDSVYRLGHAVFCIDLPGFGHSSRCEFPPDSLGTENLIVNFIKLWQENLKISKVIMIGHSMGGYLTYSYAIQYPEKLEQIVLVDAWGFPDIKRKVTESISFDSSRNINKSITKGGLVRFLSYILAPLSPFMVLRIFGRRFGPKFVGLFRQDLCKRYANLFGDDATIFNEYVYAVNSFYPSGEFGFRQLAQPFGWAKNPMVLRAKLIKQDIPISFIHGSRSWVSSESSFQIKSELRNKVRVYILPDSGHHVYTDHPRIFNHILRAIILRVEDAEADLLENVVSSAATPESCIPLFENFDNLIESLDFSIQKM